MNLHRAGNQPEWASVQLADYNYWQRLAAKTHGLVTPGNLITMAGLLIALVGLLAIFQGWYWLSLSGLVVGRLFDVADGWAANRTGTKSPLGEILDASVDKIVTIAAVLVLGGAGLVRWWSLVLLIAPHVIIIGLAGQAYFKGRRLHPSRVGKLSMAIVWVAISTLLLAEAARLPSIKHLSDGLGLLSVILGLLALGGYARMALKSASA